MSSSPMHGCLPSKQLHSHWPAVAFESKAHLQLPVSSWSVPRTDKSQPWKLEDTTMTENLSPQPSVAPCTCHMQTSAVIRTTTSARDSGWNLPTNRHHGQCQTWRCMQKWCSDSYMGADEDTGGAQRWGAGPVVSDSRGSSNKTGKATREPSHVRKYLDDFSFDLFFNSLFELCGGHHRSACLPQCRTSQQELELD